KRTAANRPAGPDPTITTRRAPDLSGYAMGYCVDVGAAAASSTWHCSLTLTRRERASMERFSGITFTLPSDGNESFLYKMPGKRSPKASSGRKTSSTIFIRKVFILQVVSIRKLTKHCG